MKFLESFFYAFQYFRKYALLSGISDNKIKLLNDGQV